MPMNVRERQRYILEQIRDNINRESFYLSLTGDGNNRVYIKQYDNYVLIQPYFDAYGRPEIPITTNLRLHRIWSTLLNKGGLLATIPYAYYTGLLDSGRRDDDALYLFSNEPEDITLGVLFAFHSNPAFARERFRFPNIMLVDGNNPSDVSPLITPLQRHLAKRLLQNEMAHAVLSLPNNAQDYFVRMTNRFGNENLSIPTITAIDGYFDNYNFLVDQLRDLNRLNELWERAGLVHLTARQTLLDMVYRGASDRRTLTDPYNAADSGYRNFQLGFNTYLHFLRQASIFRINFDEEGYAYPVQADELPQRTESHSQQTQRYQQSQQQNRNNQETIVLGEPEETEEEHTSSGRIGGEGGIRLSGGVEGVVRFLEALHNAVENSREIEAPREDTERRRGSSQSEISYIRPSQVTSARYSNIWREVSVLSTNLYDSILRRRPVGGIQYTGNEDHLVITKPDEETMRAISILNEVARNNPGAVPTFEYNMTQFPFEILTQTENRELQQKFRKALSITGAISKSGGLMQIWLPEYVAMRTYPSGIEVRTTIPNIENAPQYDYRNFDNWEVVNFEGKRVRDLDNGFFIPVGQGKVIYLPDYIVPDMTVGIEYEAPMYESSSSVKRKFREKFGIDPEWFGRYKNDPYIKVEPEGSLDYGQEYISAAMPLFDAVRFNYMLAETLREFNPHHAVNRRGDPYGLHINMGILPFKIIDREHLIRFTSQYLRIFEDIIKRTTSPDLRYEYNMRPQSWHRRYVGLPESIGSERYRQYWSRDVSHLFRVNGIVEYDVLRRGRTLTDELPGSDVALKVSKYHTISFEKLKRHSVVEFRHAIYVPNGSYIANTIGMLSKFMSDLYYSMYYTPEAINSNPYVKLIPRKRYSKQQFELLLNKFFGIEDSHHLEFMWNAYRQCQNIVR